MYALGYEWRYVIIKSFKFKFENRTYRGKSEKANFEATKGISGGYSMSQNQHVNLTPFTECLVENKFTNWTDIFLHFRIFRITERVKQVSWKNILIFLLYKDRF